MKKYKTGIALGGGGARGFAHLGMLKALGEKGIHPDILSGASAGAIVGAFLAGGMEIDDIHTLMKKQGFSNITRLKIPQDGFMSLEGLRQDLKKNIRADKLEDLEIPLYVAASNLNKAKIEYFNNGDLIDTVIASSSIPVLFSPVKIGDDLYVDGGLFDNIPYTPLTGKCERLIALGLTPVHDTHEFNNLVEIGARTFHLMVNLTKRGVKENCDLFLEPDKLDRYQILDTEPADELFEVGYEYVMGIDVPAE